VNNETIGSFGGEPGTLGRSIMAETKDGARQPTARSSWLDDTLQAPLIKQYARQLDSFLETMADGRVDTSEIQAQEARLVALMREVEPQLDDALHEKVTRLLCELTAYDLMQMLHAMQGARPKTAFRG
jgi:hypothetical protein